MDRFSSAGIPAGERQASYEAALQAYFGADYVDKQLRLHVNQPEAFCASMQRLTLGHLHGAYHVNNTPHSLTLAPSDTTSGDLDFYLLLNGEITFERDEGAVHLGAGDMTLLRCSEALSSHSRQMEMLVLCLPERLVGRRLAGRPLALNRTMPGAAGLGACLGALLRAIVERREELSLEEGIVLQESVIDAALCAASAGAGLPGGDEPQRESQLRLLQRCALNLIREPDLSARHVAHEAGVSVRTVHRLFHGSGITFREWLRERRLERCWEELTEPALHPRGVAAVAYRWGFNDLSTFNRCFRARYGIPPTVARLARSLQ